MKTSIIVAAMAVLLALPASAVDVGPNCIEERCDHPFYIVSDLTDQVDGHDAVATWTHQLWTASIPGATWIWEQYEVADPGSVTAKVFSKEFNVAGYPTSGILDIATDNIFLVRVNGVKVCESQFENNFQLETQKQCDVTSELKTGMNLIEFEVTNLAWPTSDPHTNPAGLLYKLSVRQTCGGGPEVPEFSAIAAGLVMVAGIGLIIARRR